MNDNTPDIVEELLRQERQRPSQPLAVPERPTIHYADLHEAPANDPIGVEWNYYRREVGRLLAEGHEGEWVLIKGEQIAGFWKTRQDAAAVAVQRFGLEPMLIHQVRSREPVYRSGYIRCRS